MPRTRTTLPALVALVALPLVTGAVGSPADADSATCNGQSVTISSAGGGYPGPTVTGTEGDDVILVSGSARIQALGGNDSICVTSGTVRLDAGAGNDTVLVSGNAESDTTLGSGDNSYTNTSTDLSAPGEVDSGVPGQPNHDVVHLGPRDYPLLTLPAGSFVSIDRPANATSDFWFSIAGETGDAGAWVVQPGSVTRDGVSMGTFQGFSELRGQFLFGRAASLTLMGGGQVQASVGAGHLVTQLSTATTVNLGIVPDLNGAFPTSGELNGGASAQRSALGLEGAHSASADLRRSRLVLDGRSLGLHGFGAFRLEAEKIDFRGAAGDDDVRANGCRMRLAGGPGQDLLGVDNSHENWNLMPDCKDRKKVRAFEYGGPGRDNLYGGPGRDVLIGGAGRDKAVGQGGQDRCVAEKEKHC